MAYDPTRPNQILDRPLFTYKDAVDHLMSWNGSAPDAIARTDARRACQEALREIVNDHRWSFYYKHGRLSSVADYETGTVAYDHTGGASERMLTLTTGTWPTWARYGTVKIANVYYPVATRESDTIITLEEDANPGADVASGTSYAIYRESYPLPSGFQSLITGLYDTAQTRELQYIHPRNWLLDRRYSSSIGTPSSFTIMGSRQLHDQDAVWFTPLPTEARNYDFVYIRSFRPLVTEEYATGTVSCTSGSATLTGSGTAFTSLHKGAVVRLSPNATSAPTSNLGTNPASQERIVSAVGSATSITVDSAFTTTLSGVKFCISDPVDIDQQVMLNLFLRTAERCMGTFRHRTDLNVVDAALRQEMVRARAADNRWVGVRSAWPPASVSLSQRILAAPIYGDNVE